jgi:hypothetical protein
MTNSAKFGRQLCMDQREEYKLGSGASTPLSQHIIVSLLLTEIINRKLKLNSDAPNRDPWINDNQAEASP